MATKKAKPPEQPAAPAAQIPRPRLHQLKVSNFRCIGSKPVEIELDDIVVLVGPNNAGKSSILRAYEVVMLHGSSEGHLALDDFPQGKIDAENLPTIELVTVVFEKTALGDRWVLTDPQSGEMFVREKWTWSQPGAPKKVGWEVASNDWHASEGPWGAPNVAQAYRAQPHRVGAFQKPEEQAAAVVNLLSKAITERAKELSKKKADAGGGGPTEYEQLLTTIRKFRLAIATEATTAVADVKDSLTKIVGDVFPGYAVSFDARPEDDIDKHINIYKPDPQLKMGPADGFHSTLERQGSGACRTLMWAALRIMSERTGGTGASPSDRPHLLLMDEPEICLHPDAVREACRVLYDLPKTKNWQVMITTHSPVFIDLSRDNTSIARVERVANGTVQGTTIYRPSRAKLDEDDRTELKLLNLCDPSAAEFFFAGRTVLVEGDTEYTAFRHVIAQEPARFKDIHIVRARGKACLVSLCKILNQFDKGFAILHDADREKVMGTKTKKMRVNAAWTVNKKILEITEVNRIAGRVRLLASVPNFEEAFFGEAADGEKPYSAMARLKSDSAAYQAIATLLEGLVDGSKPVPVGAMAWTSMDELKKAVEVFDVASNAAAATG